MAHPTYIIPASKPKFSPEDITVEDLNYLSKDSFALWCLTSGVKPDHNDFDFDSHRYLLPIYMDMGEEIVVRKAAQTGLSVWSMLRVLYWLETHQGRKAGYYVPTQDLAQGMSKDRLEPLMASCASIAAIADPNDKLNLKKVGASSLYFNHIGGSASKDSVPLDYLCFDEVRLMDTKDVFQTQHRIAHSPFKMKSYVSTVGMEGDTIDMFYMQGSRSSWVSKCGCSFGCNLATSFPDCVVYDDPKRPGEFYFRCPKCLYEIKDPQNGYYLREDTSADFNSYHMSQLISRYRSLKDIWREYITTTTRSEFYNSCLGLPFTDSENVGVTRDQMLESVNSDLRWAKDEKNIPPTAMGIDQGAGYVMCVIADYNKDKTKKRLRHVEIVEINNPTYSQYKDPYERVDELMKEFNVQICLTDAMPNVNSALAFAQRHPRKVFLAYYSEGQKEVVQWLDRQKAKDGVQKAGPFLKFKYVASIGRFPSLSYSLGEWAQGNWEMPNPKGLLQRCISEKTGMVELQSPADRLIEHNCKLVKRWKEADAEQGTGKWQFIFGGRLDPHLAHGSNYVNIALERLRKQASFTFA